MFSHPSFLFAFSQDYVVAELVTGLGSGVTTVEGVGLTSALTFGVSMTGVSDTTGTLALTVGVAVFLPQPAKVRTAAIVMATAQLNFFILGYLQNSVVRLSLHKKQYCRNVFVLLQKCNSFLTSHGKYSKLNKNNNFGGTYG